jgi:MEMO1 family protein
MKQESNGRPPVVAGMFYPASPRALRTLVEGFFAEVKTPAAPARGAIVPHAGLVYSGRCAAEVFARTELPRTVVVLAPNHHGLRSQKAEASVWRAGSFATPLGAVRIDGAFATRLLEVCPLVAHDTLAHSREHAIEVELPFLLLRAPETTIVPILLAWDDWRSCRELASALVQVVRECAPDALLVASSDMTHFETADDARRQDELALAEVERLDGEALLEVCHRRGITMCGRAPAATVLEASRQLGAQRATVVDYRHSGMVTGDDSNVVAYAGVVIE